MAKSTPGQAYGFKIFESPHKDRVMGLLLLKRGYQHCINFLAERGLKVNYRTLKYFEQNYVSKLEQDAADRLKSAILDEEGKEEDGIVDKFVYSKLSTAQTYKRLLDLTEEQIQALDDQKAKQKGILNDDQMKLLDKYYDRIRGLRADLEVHQLESEVEQTRVTVIKDVAKMALEIMKGDEGKQRAFISKIEEYTKAA